ncbi:hypothetical protein LJC63_12350 [Ruminococcaceae bacterium OttesenSCG-928-L11]|nr:hypothetical protein [Ruminococcaceae bacterium OttesenSCG-928-L11]
MTDKTLRSKARQLQELQAEIDQLTAQAEALKDAIKREMEDRATDEIKAGNALIRWKPVSSVRFDTKGFKSAHSSLYEQFAVPTTTRRFTLCQA